MLQIRNVLENRRASFIFSSHTPYRAFRQFVDGILCNINALEDIAALETKLKDDGACIGQMKQIKQQREFVWEQMKQLNDEEHKRLNKTRIVIQSLNAQKKALHARIAKTFEGIENKLK